VNRKVELLQSKDVIFASTLIEKAFLESVAPTMSAEGVSTFKSGLTSDAINKRLQSGNKFVVCREEGKIVGVGESRNSNHLNLLFVEPTLQKAGIGRAILSELLSSLLENEMTVNSSLNSVGAYEKFGFKKSGPESEVRGIRYQPMSLIIN